MAYAKPTQTDKIRSYPVLFVEMNVMTGLPLDSPRWDDLEHAFGEPTSTVELIRELQEYTETGNGDAEELQTRTLDEFGSNLFHQQSRYTATIAAVPHFVSLAGALPQPLRNAILHNVGWIHWLGGNSWIERDDNDAMVTSLIVDDEDLIQWYNNSIVTAAKLVVHALKESPESENDIWRQLNLLKTTVSLNGHPHLANLIHWFEELHITCPNCETELYARYMHSGYVIWEKRNGVIPAQVVNTAKRQVTAFDGSTDTLHPNDFETLLGYTPSPMMKLAEEWVRSIHGMFTCAGCEHTFRLPKDYGISAK